MPDKDLLESVVSEEIEGAPPLPSDASGSSPSSAAPVIIDRFVYQQCQQLELMVLGAQAISDLLQVLLVSMPRGLNLLATELWLHDPDGEITELLPEPHRYGSHLQLHGDAFDMQELYDIEPDVLLIEATDPRMFGLLKSDPAVNEALLLPLMDAGRLIGSLHCGAADLSSFTSESERNVMAHIAAVVSTAYQASLARERAERLSTLDPLTRVMNPRGFGLALEREIARSRRERQPLAMLAIDIDQLEELRASYGELTGDFVLKRISQRIVSDMRATDHLAKIDSAHLAMLIFGCTQSRTAEIAERLRQHIEAMDIDDGRGAVLHATISIGVVTWDPERSQLENDEQVARLINATAAQALAGAIEGGGNQVAQGSLAADA